MLLQPYLHNALVRLEPLRNSDFEELFAVASDPLIWKQHPKPTRYLREEFRTYFVSGLACGGALLVKCACTSAVIGCSRYYDYDAALSQVYVGYTFLACKYWGGEFNSALKQLMLDYAFVHVETVRLDVGITNLRSQTAVERLGAVRTGTSISTTMDTLPRENVNYLLSRQQWARRQQLQELAARFDS
jgi:N-acetyltransferase